MGALCSAMADLMAGGGADEEQPKKKTDGGEDENWEDEINMDVFYTDAVKYWEVRKAFLRACRLI